MKVYRIKDHYQKEFDEYVLGPHELGNEIGYMAWGEIEPGKKKLLKPGRGHEEIILVVEGEAALENGGGVVKRGEAFYLESGDSMLLMAGSEGCTYISAGAHVHEEGHTH